MAKFRKPKRHKWVLFTCYKTFEHDIIVVDSCNILNPLYEIIKLCSEILKCSLSSQQETVEYMHYKQNYGRCCGGAHCRPLFIDEGILTVINLYIYHCLVRVKRNLNNFIDRIQIHNYSTRFNYLLASHWQNQRIGLILCPLSCSVSYHRKPIPWMKVIGYETAISDICPWQEWTKWIALWVAIIWIMW